jgi:hypothetical protein
MLNNRSIYFSNTMTGKLFNLLNFNINDLYELYKKKGLLTKDPIYIKKK